MTVVVIVRRRGGGDSEWDGGDVEVGCEWW